MLKQCHERSAGFVDHQHGGVGKRGWHRGQRFGLVAAGRVDIIIAPVKGDLHDHVIEPGRRCQQLGIDARGIGRQQDWTSRHAQLAQQADEQITLVLAIAVAAFEDHVRGMGPLRIFADRQAEIANFILHPVQRRFGLRCLTMLFGQFRRQRFERRTG
ncbi:hypothetical protein LP420_30015 [Massilia sp. B-10]|nr:hypothetical protein LP420_30015 [Massilia sp. B-10]